MAYIYVLFIIVIISYLLGGFESYKITDLQYNSTNSTPIIEFLTQHKLKTKNYHLRPGNYCLYNRCLPLSKIVGDKVQLKYEFPLIKSHKALYDTFLYPEKISEFVDFFGLPSALIVKSANGFSLNPNIQIAEFEKKMNQNGWYFNSVLQYGVDYKAIVNYYKIFSRSIAKFIYNRLIDLNEDSYLNRVQSALNFVQFLPYGLPEFDTNSWYYFGVSTPPESLILGYSDCDSKSILFASIVAHLIPEENIILVNCTVNANKNASDGEHMMVAVAELNVSGQTIDFNSKKYLLLETTTPVAIGQFEWTSFFAKSIVSLK